MNNFDENLIHKYLPKEKWEDAINKLQSGYPIQYIIGNVEFYGCIIDVNEDVLIPRFETEYLVDDLIKYIKKYNIDNPNILDIGTGSGCISIALKKNINSNIISLDISNKAINVAKHNAEKNNVSIHFLNEDICTYDGKDKYDVIVSNPPYVSFDEKVDEKTKYEPQNAIFAPEDGLYFYKIILSKAKSLLNSKSIIAFEIGMNQANAIQNMALEQFPNSNVIIKKDLSGKDRYIYIINE